MNFIYFHFHLKITNYVLLYLGQTVLCYYNSMLYEAIVLKRRLNKEGEVEYFIHYKGWKKKWDEWVDDETVLVKNLTNIIYMESLQPKK